MSKRTPILILTVLTLLLVPITAQETAQEEASQEAPDWEAIPRGWDIKAYQARHQNISQLMELVDGFIRAPYKASVSKTYNTLTLLAPESIHDTVGMMIERFDQPASNVEVKFYLLRAMRQSNGHTEGLSEDLQPVLEDLATVTQFQSFELMATPVVRIRSGETLLLTGGSRSSYEIRTGDVRAENNEDVYLDSLSVEVVDFSESDGTQPAPRPDNIGRSSMRISVDLKSGEYVVLGTSQLTAEAGTALVVIVKATILD